MPFIQRKERYPEVDVRARCGARGDGRTDDTAAFQSAADILQRAGGGTLIIPRGVYRVGRQEHIPFRSPYYRSEDVFSVRDLRFLQIEGNGATLRLAPGLRYGAFDKQTGSPIQPTLPFYDRDCAVFVGNMIVVTGSRRVTIRDLNLDGNSDSLILGGPWGDTGRQLSGTGLVLYNNTGVDIHGVRSHHHALDGAMIGWTGLKVSDPPTPHLLADCAFEVNGRQGLSWVGGRGLNARRCRFSDTGRGKLSSAPGAGLDIEAEDSVCRDGLFEDCQFLDNAGCGMVADSGDGGHSRFVRCTFWGTTGWSAWSARPGLQYEDCSFFGSLVHTVGDRDNPTLATRFRRCRFEDRPWKPGGQVYRGGFLVETDRGGENVSFDSCTFIANALKSVWFGGGEGRGRFTACRFLHRNAQVASGDFQCLIRNADLVGCRFEEKFPAGTDRNWYVATGKTRILSGSPTTVEGPRLRWSNRTGIIPPGEYE